MTSASWRQELSNTVQDVQNVDPNETENGAKSASERALDLMVAVVWALVAGGYLWGLRQERSLAGLGLFIFYTLVAVSFLRRRAARRTPTWWENGLALFGVFLPMFGLRPAATGWPIAGVVVQVLSLAGMIVALGFLGRSFGIAPADRGVVRHGFYAVIRHPLYACETLFYLGFLCANLSIMNGLAVIMITAITVVRILREERIISGYQAYAQQVHWRLLPFVW